MRIKNEKEYRKILKNNILRRSIKIDSPHKYENNFLDIIVNLLCDIYNTTKNTLIIDNVSKDDISKIEYLCKKSYKENFNIILYTDKFDADIFELDVKAIFIDSRKEDFDIQEFLNQEDFINCSAPAQIGIIHYEDATPPGNGAFFTHGVFHFDDEKGTSPLDHENGWCLYGGYYIDSCGNVISNCPSKSPCKFGNILDEGSQKFKNISIEYEDYFPYFWEKPGLSECWNDGHPNFVDKAWPQSKMFSKEFWAEISNSTNTHDVR